MSLTPEEQRVLAIECGAVFDERLYINTQKDSIVFMSCELAAYTAAVEAKCYAEVAELTRKLAEQQAWSESVQTNYDGLLSKWNEDQLYIGRLMETIKQVQRLVAYPSAIPSVHIQNSFVTEVITEQTSVLIAKEELNALLAKERERVAKHLEEQISHSDADDEIDICVGHTLSTAVAQIRSLK